VVCGGGGGARLGAGWGSAPAIFRCVPAAGAGETGSVEKAEKGPYLAG